MEENKCTLSNEELIARSEAWVHKLAETRGQAWTLRVPVDFNYDPDMLFCELCKRLKEATAPPTPLELEQLRIDTKKQLMSGFDVKWNAGVEATIEFMSVGISSILQAKDERIKELERAVKKVSWIGESLQSQLQEKDSEIAQLKKELEDKKAVG